VRRATERNLPPEFLEKIEEIYSGTRMFRQECLGELLHDVPGALFKEEWLRRADIPPELLETCTVGVDPSSGTVKGDATGIVVAAMLKGGKDYAVLEDCTIKGSPGLWGDTVVAAADGTAPWTWWWSRTTAATWPSTSSRKPRDGRTTSVSAITLRSAFAWRPPPRGR